MKAIIVDNASTDNTKAIILEAANHDPRIHYLHVKLIGLGAGRDTAWRDANGDIVCFTDDDCYVAKDYVEQITRAFAEHPDVGVIGGRIMLHDPTDARVTIDESLEPRIYPSRQAIRAGALHGANLSFRRSALVVGGGFDPALGAGTAFPCEDIDAVAAVVWAGYQARYDPRPVVSHHHGRKDADIPSLYTGYDAGRGAYWAKYMIRPDTRLAYLKKWWSVTKGRRKNKPVTRVTGEIKGTIRYAADQRLYTKIAIALAIAVTALGFLCER